MYFDSVKQWVKAGMPFHSYVLGDCNEAMGAMPDGFVDLSIVDPPYGIGAAKEKPHNGWVDWGIKQWD